MQKYAQPKSITAQIRYRIERVARKIDSDTLDAEKRCRLHTHRQCLSCDLQIMSNVHENDVVINVIQGRIMMYFIEATVCFFFVIIISHLSLQVCSPSSMTHTLNGSGTITPIEFEWSVMNCGKWLLVSTFQHRTPPFAIGFRRSTKGKQTLLLSPSPSPIIPERVKKKEKIFSILIQNER